MLQPEAAEWGPFGDRREIYCEGSGVGGGGWKVGEKPDSQRLPTRLRGLVCAAVGSEISHSDLITCTEGF